VFKTYEPRLAFGSGWLLLCSAVVVCHPIAAAAVDEATTPPAVQTSGDAAAATSSTAPATPSDAAAAPAKPAGSPAVLKQIAHWEDQFFTRQYATEDVDKRLTRIEQLVFGTIETGSDEERIAKLKTALNQPSDGPAVPAGVAEFVPQTKTTQADDGTPTRTNTVAATPPATTSATENGSTPPASSDTAGSSQPAVPSAVNGIIDDRDTAPPVVKSLNLEDKPMRVAELHVNKKQFDTVLKPQRVIQNLSEAIRDNPKDPELVYQRAKAYIQLDKFDKALTDLSDAIESQPNRSDFYLARAWVYHLLGNSVMADLDLSRARFVDPHFPEKVDWED
jgi:tetratricopeptide (TPR) repeat protein